MENSNFFNPNWENSMEDFQSALSSMVSSPTASNCNNNDGQNIVLKELIGKLGGICDHFNTNSTYTTPLNSPPKFIDNFQNPRNHFPPFSSENNGEKSSISISGEIGLNLQIDTNSRKRKPIQRGKGKGKGIAAAKDAIANVNVGIGSENSELSAKRSKSDEKQSSSKDSPKDYIHVRARRGQATDAHSLAERVRREKIGERMQVLQDLVPGCNKVTGKAIMLDEIINYVQSLQRQVEFLSMKLTTINPIMELNTESVVSKEMMQPRGSLPHEIHPSGGYTFQSQQNFRTKPENDATEASFHNASFGLNQSMMENFGGNVSQVSSTFWEDDLHSVVQMGYGQNESQDFQI